MSVTFAAKQPIMAKAQFGHQNQQPPQTTQFSGSVNPSDNADTPKQQKFSGCTGCIPLDIAFWIVTLGSVWCCFGGAIKKAFKSKKAEA